MTLTTNGANSEENAPPVILAAQPKIADQRNALDLYLDTFFGHTTGYACVGIGRKPYLNEQGRYTFPKGGWRESSFRWPEERDELVKVVLGAEDSDADVYLCPYLRSSPDREKGNAVDRRFIHADIDVQVPVEKVEALGGFAVDSGTEGHGHAYIALSAPVSTEQHEALCRAWGRHLVGRADAKVSDNDLLRPPGSVNRKPTVRGKAASPVRWLVKP
jgi:hypothetical protein